MQIRSFIKFSRMLIFANGYDYLPYLFLAFIQQPYRTGIRRMIGWLVTDVSKLNKFLQTFMVGCNGLDTGKTHQPASTNPYRFTWQIIITEIEHRHHQA